MRYARIYPWRRTRRSRALWNGPDAFFVAQFLQGSTTNMSGFDLRQGQGVDMSAVAFGFGIDVADIVLLNLSGLCS
jgi:hypothetical protein